MGRLEMKKRRYWTAKEVAILCADYPRMKTIRIAEKLGRTERQVWNKAMALGIKKSQEYLATPDACRMRRGDDVGKEYRFEKGFTPWNKGMKGLSIGGKDTQFRKGHIPSSYKPVGSERVSNDGYLYRKVADTGVKKVDWVMVHVLLWQEHNGPVQEGHVVVFKDGNKSRIEIENLECISRVELMRRNTVHRLPKEIVQIARLRSVLNRQINRRVGNGKND